MFVDDINDIDDRKTMITLFLCDWFWRRRWDLAYCRCKM